MTPQRNSSDLDQRRANARRTAWIVAGVAVAILVLFVLRTVQLAS